MQYRYSLLAASLATALSISGCGGDEGGSSPKPTGTEGKPPINEPIVGGVVITTIDGYLKHALVCSDLDRDGDCQANEIITDNNGKLVLTNDKGLLDITVTKEIEDNFNNFPVVVKILEPYTDYSKFGVQPGIYTVDMDQPYQAMGKKVAFRAPAGAKIASPITDLVVAEMSKGHEKAEAEANVQVMLSSLKENGDNTEIDLYADYIDVKNNADNDEEKNLASKLHKTAQILTETQHQATDDINLDQVTEQVVKEAVTTVNAATEDDLADPNYKPVIPVEKDENDNIKVKAPVINHQAIVDNKVLKPVAAELKDATMKTGENFAFFGSNIVTGLFTDADQNDAPKVTITDESSQYLKQNGIHAELTIDNTIQLTAMQNGTITKAGTYYLELAADDLDENGKTIGQVTTLLEFTVIAPTAPTVDQARLEQLQQNINGLTLEAGRDIGSISLSIEDLFTDKDGDELTYSFADGNTGLNYDVQYPEVMITGTPQVSGSYSVIIIATDGRYSSNAKITFNIAKQTSNPLTDILVGKNMYRFEAEGETTVRPDCWAFRLTDDNKIMQADSVHGACPAESSIVNEVGSWAIDGDNIDINLIGENPLTFELKQDNSHATKMPRVHLYEITSKATIANTTSGYALENETESHPATFYVGKDAAEFYWNQSASNYLSYAIIGNEVTTIRAGTYSSLAKARYNPSKLDPYLIIDSSCENLGFEADGQVDPWNHPTYRWSSNLVYDFYYLNEKLENGMIGLEHADGIATNDTNTDSCLINFRYNGTADVLPGEAVTIFASPKAGIAGNEEFLINTYTDRNNSVQPRASLPINETGIFITEISDGVGTVIHLYLDNGEIREEERAYTPGKGWSDPMPITSKFTPYQIDGKQLYQVWAEDEPQDESFTVWTDNGNTVKYVDAGINGGDGSDENLCSTASADFQDACIGEAPFYQSEDEAKAKIEAIFKSDLNFIGTSWTTDYQEISQAVTFDATGGNYNDQHYAWNIMPNDLPCLVEGDHVCTFSELNATYNFCDSGDPSTLWENCQPEQQYLVHWRFNPFSRILYRDKESFINGYKVHNRMVQMQ